MMRTEQIRIVITFVKGGVEKILRESWKMRRKKEGCVTQDECKKAEMRIESVLKHFSRMQK